jgi:phosphopantothenoylcysteine decarboxylase / phosphopantothenate---cysteine ligase
VKVALGITGCIAAYKAIEVMRGLQKAGGTVQVILTRSARKFVAPLTFESLSGQKVISDMFRRELNLDIRHISLAQECAALAVVPATANILGKFAHGIADDFLTTLYLSCPAPVILAPAMNVEMWNHPATRANVETLKARGHHFVDPEPGMLACGMEGEGRLAEVGVIVNRILSVLKRTGALEGVRVLVTAGPTVEDMDPVRFLSNRSSGKMGYAVAAAAAERGAEVTLVSGPTSLACPAGVSRIEVRSAAEMKSAVLNRYPESDIVVAAAAVADYRPAKYEPEKIKKGSGRLLLELSATDDILAQLGREKGEQVLVGFAAETERLTEHALAKMTLKNLDFVVANDVTSGVFGAESASVTILTEGGKTVALTNRSKSDIAHQILDLAESAHAARKSRSAPV